jgi:hypothetical protein
MRMRLLPALLLLSIASSVPGCAAIGDAPGFDEGGGSQPPGSGPNDPGSGPGDPAVCLGDGTTGGVCDVTADCNAPLICLDGACVGPRDPSITCDVLDGVSCSGAGEVCVAGACVVKPGSCDSVDQCPIGYLCQGGQCLPERDGEACADTGPGPDLSGQWRADSVLHLRDGLPSVVASLLSTAQKVRDITLGNVNFGLPSLVNFFINSIVSSVVRDYVPQWAVNLAVVLGDLGDILDDMRVESTITLTGQPCAGVYRGTERWDFITFRFRGQELRVPPDRLPGVSQIIPDEFSATYSCGRLYIDRHRIRESLSGVLRFLLDNVTNAVTGRPNLEAALSDIVDCWGVAVTLDNYLYSVCSYCPIITGLVNTACNGLKATAINEMSQRIDAAAVSMSLVKRKGIANVAGDRDLSGGVWYGSLAGGDFPGSFSARRQ